MIMALPYGLAQRLPKLRGAYKYHSSKSLTSEVNKAFNQNLGSTVLKSTVGQFGKHANVWWDEYGEFIALHSLNKLRVPLIRDGLLSTKQVSDDQKNGPLPLSGMKILDVGCGGGILSESLARLGCSVVGIDVEPEGIAVAEEHAYQDLQLKKRITYQATTIEEHSAVTGPVYDAVVASEVLEHVDQQHYFLETCTKLVQPGGSLFVTTLNRTKASWVLGILMAENVLRIVPKGVHDWNQFMSPYEVQSILEKYGCHTQLIHGMLYEPVCNKWNWVPYLGICYALHAIKCPSEESVT